MGLGSGCCGAFPKVATRSATRSVMPLRVPLRAALWMVPFSMPTPLVNTTLAEPWKRHPPWPCAAQAHSTLTWKQSPLRALVVTCMLTTQPPGSYASIVCSSCARAALGPMGMLRGRMYLRVRVPPGARPGCQAGYSSSLSPSRVLAFCTSSWWGMSNASKSVAGEVARSTSAQTTSSGVGSVIGVTGSSVCEDRDSVAGDGPDAMSSGAALSDTRRPRERFSIAQPSMPSSVVAPPSSPSSSLLLESSLQMEMADGGATVWPMRPAAFACSAMRACASDSGRSSSDTSSSQASAPSRCP
ncbi:hypothetical protein V8C86DRAFT_2474063 [Haematococcus lacustris]